MGILDEFDMVVGGGAGKKPFVTIRPQTVTFSMYAVELLNHASYVRVYIDNKKKRIALTESDSEENGFPFYAKPEEGKQALVRWTGKEKTSYFLNMLSTPLDKKGIRVNGTYYPEDKALVFEFRDL